MTQPGWHPDPLGDARRERYFDGATWTSRTRPRQRLDSSGGRGGRLAAVLAGAVGLAVVAAGVWGAGSPALVNPPVTVAPPSLGPATVEPPRFDCVADAPARLPSAAWVSDVRPPAAGWAGPEAIAYPYARAAEIYTDRAPARFPLSSARALLIVGELDHRSSQGWFQTVAEQLLACVVPLGFHVNNATVTSTTDVRGPFEVDARVSRPGQDTTPAMLAKVVLVAHGDGDDRGYAFLLWRAPAEAAADLRSLRLAEDRFVGRR